MKKKLIRITTVPISLEKLLEGQLKYLNQFYEVIVVSGAGKSLNSVNKREGVKTVAIEIQRQISLVKDLSSLWKLYKLFKRENPTIVHSITPKAGLLSMMAGYFAGVPIRMHTFTGLVFPTKKGFIQRLLITMDKLLCVCATNVYPEGIGVRNDLMKYKITKKPLKILANGNVNGINTTYFNPQQITQTQKENLQQKLGIQKEAIVFIFVGRLVGDKGINELVVAFKKLQKPSTLASHFSLLLVGSLETDLDPLKHETLEEITNNKHIISVGWQEDVRSYFAISDILVFPSYREGFPNVVLQAGAMGLPSIVTNINGCNEIVEEGKNGLVIPVKDGDAIYTAMKKMVEDENYRLVLQENARAMIVSRYEQLKVWEAILEEYKRLGKKV